MSEELIPKVGDVLLIETRILGNSTWTRDKVTAVATVLGGRSIAGVRRKLHIVQAGCEFVWRNGRGSARFAAGAESFATISAEADVKFVLQEKRRLHFWASMRESCEKMIGAARRHSVSEAKAALTKMQEDLQAFEEENTEKVS